MAPLDWPRLLRMMQTASGKLPEDERLGRVKSLIDADASAPLPLDMLARHACLSREHFIRAFKRTYGLTPHRYVNRQRVRLARDLLEQTTLPVTEVCFEVGFTSLGSFSTMFKKQLGHSPERYRRRIVQNLGLVALPFIPGCFAMRFGHFSRSEDSR